MIDFSRLTALAAPDVPTHPPDDGLQTMVLRDGLGLSVQNLARQDGELSSAIVGDDLFKVMVQFSGSRHLTFAGRHNIDICGGATAVLMHDAGLPKTERLLAQPRAQSIVVSLPRERLWSFLDEEQTAVSSDLQSFVVRRRARPRLAVATPKPAELAAATAVIGVPQRPLRRLHVEARALQLFCSILDRFQDTDYAVASATCITSRDRRQLSAVRDFLSSHFVEPPTLHGLARQFGLNRNKLCTGFRVLYGASIYDFCRNLRLEQAHRLLAYSDLPIARIAEESGFDSASAFSAAFSRQFGQTPSQLRRT